jgi:hypothetical protein
MIALTTAQNLLRVIISEATDITKETRPSRACARRLLYGYRIKLIAALFFQKILFTPHQMQHRAPLGVRNLSYNFRISDDLYYRGVSSS